MWKTIMVGLLLAVAMLAAPPIPSKVLTAKVSADRYTKGSLVVDAVIPPDSQLFEDEQEVLASINTANFVFYLCELGMHTILTRHK